MALESCSMRSAGGHRTRLSSGYDSLDQQGNFEARLLPGGATTANCEAHPKSRDSDSRRLHWYLIRNTRLVIRRQQGAYGLG
jgi:hypothetical protein